MTKPERYHVYDVEAEKLTAVMATSDQDALRRYIREHWYIAGEIPTSDMIEVAVEDFNGYVISPGDYVELP